MKRAFEDFSPGDTIAYGPRVVSRAEIIAFATEFDPQPFHLDERGGEDLLVGGLMASGWHVCALWMRMVCDAWLVDSTGMGSPGVGPLQWRQPVRPGDTLSGASTVLDARASKSRPELGIVRFRHELRNQHGHLVMTMENPVLFGRRARP